MSSASLIRVKTWRNRFACSRSHAGLVVSALDRTRRQYLMFSRDLNQIVIFNLGKKLAQLGISNKRQGTVTCTCTAEGACFSDRPNVMSSNVRRLYHWCRDWICYSQDSLWFSNSSIKLLYMYIQLVPRLISDHCMIMNDCVYRAGFDAIDWVDCHQTIRGSIRRVKNSKSKPV
jgi:hypothetical protein